MSTQTETRPESQKSRNVRFRTERRAWESAAKSAEKMELHKLADLCRKIAKALKEAKVDGARTVKHGFAEYANRHQAVQAINEVLDFDESVLVALGPEDFTTLVNKAAGENGKPSKTEEAA